MNHPEVLVVGGGPAGMMAGYLFARAGVRTLVIEKHKDFLRDFRGDTVHPSTLALFDELGLLDGLLARPHDKVRDVGAVHTRLAPGFVVDTVLEPGARIVTFANGLVARETIIDCDDETRRLAWAISNERLSHYHASLQVFAEGRGGTRLVWIADLQPDSMKDRIAATIEAGLAAMKAHLDRAAA